MAKKYLHTKIPSKPVSYQKYLNQELDKIKHRLKFTLHEYWKQMPSDMQKLYDMTSAEMRDMGCILLVLKNSSKQICGHLLIDREYYLTEYKPKDREDLDQMIESVTRNFIAPMENYLNGKKA